MRQSVLGLVAVCLALAAGTAVAHHSFAMFDGNKLVIVRGTMLGFTYLSPHAWISILGKVEGRGGKEERWDVESTAPGSLSRMGIRADTLKVGDKVTMGIRPLRDGRRGGSMVFVVTADGVAHGAKPSDLGLDVATLKP